MEIDSIKLSTFWTLYYHNPDNMRDWSTSSYERIGEIHTPSDFHSLMNKFSENSFHFGMFFLMRENIPPQWEDPINCNGGYWSYKIMFSELYHTWLNVTKKLLCEQLLQNYSTTISGITISPKKGFSILKIWNVDKIVGANSYCDMSNTNLDESYPKFVLFSDKKS